MLAQVEHGDDVGVGTQASHGLGLPVNPGHAYQPIIAPPHQKPTPNLGFHFVSRYWGVITVVSLMWAKEICLEKKSVDNPWIVEMEGDNYQI